MDRARGKLREGRGDDREKRGKSHSRMHPRAPMMPGFHEVVRCSSCGSALPGQFEITSDTQCPACSQDLHVCKNCVSFDTGSRFECRKPIAERVSRKDSNNTCLHFEARRALERQTGSTPVSTPSNPSNEDPRAAFERLFKK